MMNIIKRPALFRNISSAYGECFNFLPFTQERLFSNRSYRDSSRLAAIRRMCTANWSMHRPEYEDFFRYTSGRWVWDEEQQLKDRYRLFDVDKLKDICAKSVGSDSCTSMIKLTEGGYNKVFRLVMNDEKSVIARIPNPNSGPPFYTTASEVATMELVRNFCPCRRCIIVRQETNLIARPEPYFKCLSQEYIHRAVRSIIPLAQNISSWMRQLEPNFQLPGTN